MSDTGVPTPTPGERNALLAFLLADEARAAAETLDRAIGWTVLCFCQWPDGVGVVTVYGWWQDPLDASRWASEFQAQMEADTADDTDAPTYATIPHPVMPQ